MGIGNVFGAAFKAIGISWSWNTEKTGVNNMKDPAFLIKAQDTVWNNPAFKATIAGGVEVTHCNQAWLAVCQGVGCHVFDRGPGQEPYTADELFTYFIRNNPSFVEKDMPDVQQLANAGALIAACLDSHTLGEAHGHIVSLTPGKDVWSPSLQKNVPVCLNIAGTKMVNTIPITARSIGINFAFPMMRATPRFFAWKESL